MSNYTNYIYALTPLVPNLYLLYMLENNSQKNSLLKTLFLSILGYFLTIHLIPIIGQHTLKKGLSGKDLGKKGSKLENHDVPEALGLVSATCFLICAILTQCLFGNNDTNTMMMYNAALFSVCFMTFLGFCDDTLDLAWRYKLILPPLASLPLLAAYTGETALYVPLTLRSYLMIPNSKELTLIGSLLDMIPFVTVDTEAAGTIVELGPLFLVFMGLLAVFCTNSINILAGINGLECGQSYIIGCSILFFKLFDIYSSSSTLTSTVSSSSTTSASMIDFTGLGLGLDSFGTNSNLAETPSLFTAVMVMPFIATSLGLLKYNWYPAQVFVGDTYCYFAGMTFAVLGILGHFSKTLLLMFLPQVINFIYSLPQLFKIVPCPRHRLPKVYTDNNNINNNSRDELGIGLLEYSRFPCESHEYRWWGMKTHADATHCPNLTLICLVLRCTGPLRERTLCLVMLGLQIASAMLAFYVRYYLFAESTV